jgi:hypothetical protein
MSDGGIRRPAPGGVAEDGADAGTPAPHLLLDMVRRLRARERGYLADVVHDGPMQELAAASLELAEARRAVGTSQSDELGVVAQQVDAAGRSLRRLQDELCPFPRPTSGLAAALSRRTGWLLATPLAVDAGAGTAGLAEAEIQLVADIVELILVSLDSTTEAPARALAEVRADGDLIFLEVNMLTVSGDAAGDGPATPRASLRRLAAGIQAGADIGLLGRRSRVRMEIPRSPGHRSEPA